MNNYIRQYKKALKKSIHCSSSVKRNLINRFDRSLSNYLDEHPSPTLEELIVAFGPPEEMAKILLEEVNEVEISRFRKFALGKKAIGCILVAIIMTFAVYILYFKQCRVITIVEENEIQETHYILGGE